MNDDTAMHPIADDGFMDEFLVTLAGADDHWMFISSRGALTAGRQDAEHALFPYGTVDKVFASRGDTGPKTLIRDTASGNLWEPFADWTRYRYAVERTVAKNAEGTKIRFEERNMDLGLSFSYSWEFSGRYGFVRRAKLADLSGLGRKIETLDGLQNILSPGISCHLQTELSCLVDAYKDNVIDPASGMAVFSLSALVTDKATPAEALAASVAWFRAATPARLSLDRACVADFGAGRPFAPVARSCGKRGDLFARRDVALAAGGEDEWLFCADRDLDAARVRSLAREIAAMDSDDGIIADIKANRLRLRELVASCDGLCAGALAMHELHHFSNVLYNSLRGGIPLGGYSIDRRDLLDYLRTRNPGEAERAARLLTTAEGADAASGRLTLETLGEVAAACGSRDLARLLREYLPLGFSRRHGDPSRPWNRFSIRIRDAAGNPAYSFQGNWRDIFQNWEALSASWPGYLPSFCAAFLDATTLDGYNPYRIGRDGIDWERPDPENPWANIGYWSDHQIIYIQKLFERLDACFPGTLESCLGARNYSYACVPYRIAGFAATCRTPRSTIEFDPTLDREIGERVAREGTDGKLVHGADGSVYAGTLAEKLLTLALPKIANLVPGGGIWINAQRPEWNDANNALVGAGLSVVTLAYLRRFLSFWGEKLAPLGDRRFAVSADVAEFAGECRSILEKAARADGKGERAETDPAARYAFMERMGSAAERYRNRVYRNMRFAEAGTEIAASEIGALFGAAIGAVDATLAAQERDDGLFHSYNILALDLDREKPLARVERLPLMLEGQVAVLSSGYLGAERAADLLESLPRSALYRKDQNSYLLYPAKKIPCFLEKNVFPEEKARSVPLLARLLDEGEPSVVTASGDGMAHFGAGMENEDTVRAAVGKIGGRPGYGTIAGESLAAVLALYEETFRHSTYTGRSGTMYAYEGIGSIYWHMVSKLLLAAGELWVRARGAGPGSGADETAGRLASMYRSIRDGLGYRRSAKEYGAFPWDPYSHTPADSGARQPGMTGQVKEEILTRLIENGVMIRGGRLAFAAAPFMEEEALPAGPEVRRWKNGETGTEVDVREGEFAFSFCGIPVVRTPRAIGRMLVTYENGTTTVGGPELDEKLSSAVFLRTSGIRSIRLE